MELDQPVWRESHEVVFHPSYDDEERQPHDDILAHGSGDFPTTAMADYTVAKTLCFSPVSGEP